MTKYIQGRNGKFAGSIGDGKHKTPAAPGNIPVNPHLIALRQDMAAAHVPSKMSIFGKTFAQASEDLETAAATRRAYWNALLDDRLHTINAMASRTGQPPITPEERALIVENADLLYHDETREDILINTVNRNFNLAVGATLFATGARLQQKGLKGWIAARTSDRIAKRLTELHNN
jgi:hypothetical protein